MIGIVTVVLSVLATIALDPDLRRCVDWDEIDDSDDDPFDGDPFDNDFQSAVLLRVAAAAVRLVRLSPSVSWAAGWRTRTSSNT